ncbi:MAG: hypothetical protein HLUCCA12_12540 [Rhodobacteraceae bacterium HLUCCA12]|nr:MAG: hypothetical protein HLUCCA12_12540 [Rhodobacteraceae bacterium HLUCCA12]
MPPIIIRLLVLLALVVVTGCTKPVVFAADEDVLAARYAHEGPAEIRFFNVISNERGQGEHAALLINASERVLFDPAGTWQHPQAPERHDVHFGMTDSLVHTYTYYHARRTHHVRIQTLEVPAEAAERILQLAKEAGPVPDAYCARSIAGILHQIPGFEDLPQTFYPNRLSDAFAELPGVTEERIYSDREPTERQTYTGLQPS